MEAIIMYLSKMLLCSAVLSGYYWLALRNARFHQWNRFYLLAAMLLSIVLPFVTIPIVAAEEPTMVVTVISALPWNYAPVRVSVFTWQNAAILLAIGISVMMLLHLLLSVMRVLRLYRKHSSNRMGDVDIVITEEPSAPFSFFRWLFWRQDIDPDSENGKRMLQHELTHIGEKHSIDKLFAELVLAVFWMNPFFWMIRRELFAIHEFLADRKAIAHYDGAAFAAMILQAAHARPIHAFSNPFFTSQLKRRLIMITTSHAPRYSYLRRISGLLLMVGMAFTLVLTIENAMAQKAPPPPPPSPAPAPEAPALPDSIISIKVWDKKGECMMTYGMKDGRIITLTLNEAKRKGYPATPPAPPPPPPPAAPGAPSSLPDSIVSMKLWDNDGVCMMIYGMKDGSVITMSLVDAELSGYPSPPPASPRVGVAVTPLEPIAPAPAGNAEKAAFTIKSSDGAEPLYVYAGLVITRQQMEEIDPNTIEQVDVLKGETAISRFGDRGKNGVVVITPKDGAFNNLQPITVVGTPGYHTVYDKSLEPKTVVGSPSKAKVVTGYPAVKGNSSNTFAADEITVHGYGKTVPLVFIDDKKASMQELNALAPDDIKSLNIWKGEQAVEKFGTSGANGVIEAFTKKMDKVFYEAEIMPSFPGGEASWRRYLEINMLYPQKAIDNATQGDAIIQFTVSAEGFISNVEIVQDPGNGIGEEAVRLIKKGPKWSPAVQNGKRVAAIVKQKVSFRLQ